MARFDLSDEEWAITQPLLPQRGRGPSRRDDRTILNGIFYILRTGVTCPNAMALRQRSIIVMSGGASAGSGRADSKPSLRSARMRFCLLIAPSSRLTVQRLGQKKGNFKKVLAAHAAVAQAKFTWL